MSRANQLLARMLGSGVSFREGQLESIASAALTRQRTLVVQRTGWGKSLVYFIATRLLRDAGEGPAILVSPLLSLMRDQVAAARRIGVRAARIDSSNPDDWSRTERALQDDEVDILLVSPERLANERFQRDTLAALGGRVGLLVVDEAHCISDWGHDFRPDYRRIVRIVRELPPRSPLIATTATANARVVADIEEQFGPNLRTIRGPLARASLRIQAMRLGSFEARLAWLADHVHRLQGTGIIYCLTKRTCARVSAWLDSQGIAAPAYHAEIPDREDLERKLLRNEVKALVATVALGMGFDKPDLGFVVHVQRPGSLIAYYQQIGRAGRALDTAVAIVLEGAEDDDICRYFIESAFPKLDEMLAVRRAIATAPDGLTVRELHQQVNLGRSRIERILKLLEVDGAIFRDERRYFASAVRWEPDTARPAAVTRRRYEELNRMKAFMASDGCLMEFVVSELDDPDAARCGRCANCAGEVVPAAAKTETVLAARRFLRSQVTEFLPRKQWASRKRIAPDRQAERGRALTSYGDGEFGQAVWAAVYTEQHIGDDLVSAAAAAVRRWAPQPAPRWVTAVPSTRRPALVREFARRLATVLDLPFRDALRKCRDTDEQKTMENSFQQEKNVKGAFEVMSRAVLPGAVLLVDDIVRSRWTFTVCADVLRAAGSGQVHPFALASAAETGDD